MAAAVAAAAVQELAATLIEAGVDPGMAQAAAAIDDERVAAPLRFLVLCWRCSRRSIAHLGDLLASVPPHETERHAGVADQLAQTMAEQRAIGYALRLICFAVQQ